MLKRHDILSDRVQSCLSCKISGVTVSRKKLLHINYSITKMYSKKTVNLHALNIIYIHIIIPSNIFRKIIESKIEDIFNGLSNFQIKNAFDQISRLIKKKSRKKNCQQSAN